MKRKTMQAVLILEDGTVFHGRSFGAQGINCGEVVFNTAMSGYQEILTDPSYHEQIVTMTYPLIGNYGTNEADAESRGVFAKGFIVKEYCDWPSNWRSGKSLGDYLKENGVIGLEGIDTRKLVLHIREKGAMRAVIAAGEYQLEKLKAQLADYPGLVGRDIVKDVAAKEPYGWDEGVSDILSGSRCKGDDRYKVVAYDFGIKRNIIRLLVSYGCRVQVVPAKTSAVDVISLRPDGVFLSNGPGDPEPVKYATDAVSELLGQVPIFGICLGHQILGQALGGKTYKLKFGHHGANHPVKNLQTGSIEITSQNHGFCVDMDSLSDKGVEITHMNLNDKTVEGIRCPDKAAFSVQYHPEAAPGPHDSGYLFERFTKLMAKSQA